MASHHLGKNLTKPLPQLLPEEVSIGALEAVLLILKAVGATQRRQWNLQQHRLSALPQPLQPPAQQQKRMAVGVLDGATKANQVRQHPLLAFRSSLPIHGLFLAQKPPTLGANRPLVRLQPVHQPLQLAHRLRPLYL